MRIAALTLSGAAGWGALDFPSFSSSLNVIHGPDRSGKSTIADLLGHALFGKPPVALPVLGRLLAPAGDVSVDDGVHQYRVRRYQEGSGTVRLTVAAVDGTHADAGTVHKLTGGLPPRVLSALCDVSFRESPHVGRLLSAEFVQGCRFIRQEYLAVDSRRLTELAARRDQLAQELETRIAAERRVSKDLETRWRELDRLVRDTQQQIAALEQRRSAIETALAETDARLRYRRLELDVDQQWYQAELPDWQTPLAELDEQVRHWRGVIADLAQRESVVRARLGEVQPSRTVGVSAIADQRAWLAVARQLAVDLAGEVSRLARAAGSDQCVCHDAHPRLRPVVESLERQLDVLESISDDQQRAICAAELRIELDRLTGSQEELRRHVEHLLDRRQALGAGLAECEYIDHSRNSLSQADAEQLEARRFELEQERFDLVERLRSHADVLRELKEQRESVDRERAALLSARSIEHVQRELADVQQKLERAANLRDHHDVVRYLDNIPAAASEILAQLSDGDLVQLIIGEGGLEACVTDRSGETFPVELLSAAHRDQVYLSLCLALLHAASRQGIWLPLVLDEPFERLDARTSASLACVLEQFCRRGHQVIVFTRHREAAERLRMHGAMLHDLLNLRSRSATDQAQPAPIASETHRPVAIVKRRPAKRRPSVEGSAKSRPERSSSGDPRINGKSDAA